MTQRSIPYQAFIDAARVAFCNAASTPLASEVVAEVFSRLQTPTGVRQGNGVRQSACSHLLAALAIEIKDAALRQMVERFSELEPSLDWSRRDDPYKTASSNFAEGHANAMIVGPGGLENRRDVWLGVSLLAPNVRYPDHHHAPAEVYLVSSEGEFRQGGGEWFSPGVGGSFYNIPDIKHAMRSTEKPLFAFWALLSEQAA